MSPGSPSTRRRLLVGLRVVLALAILTWVGFSLPWSDELAWADGAGQELVINGRIEGDWKDDRAHFWAADDASLSGWPEADREARTAGRALVVQRRGEGGAGYDWHPGMPKAFREMDVGGLLLAQACFLVAVLTIVTRWWRLLEQAGCRTTWWNALRLTFIGLFFNNVIPGATGGDLVKGVMVAKENPGRGAEALVTVLVDRVFGMVALAILALTVILVHGGAEELRTGLIVGLGICALGAALYASKTFRRKTGLSALVDRLPLSDKLRSIDRAALLYLKSPAFVVLALLFSFANHALVCLGVFFLGQALGADVELVDYLVVVPIANLVSAVPVAPGGWGVGELAFRQLFLMIGASPALGVAVSVTFRLSQLALGLFGGVALLFPGSRSELREAQSA